MKRLPEFFPLLLVLAVLAACVPQPPERPGTVEIRLSVEEGSVIVDPESVRVVHGQPVRWVAADRGAPWFVVFSDSTPMMMGRQVFQGGPNGMPQGTVSRTAVVGQRYKYGVFYPVEGGEYLHVDPELWVIDD